MTKEKLNAFFITEEQLGERKINVLRLAFLAVFLLNEFSNYYVLKVVAGWLHERAVWTMLAWLAYAGGAWYLVNKRRLYDRPVKYISAAADALFLTLTIVLVEGNNGPLVPVYYILIVGCALRYSYRAILAAAGFSALGYAAVWYYSFGNPRLTPIPTYSAIIHMLIMSMMGAFAAYAVKKMRDLVLKFAENLLRREQAEGALSRYVSHQVARKILDTPDGAASMGEGRRTHAAILFSDIRGFTPLSEGMDPAALVKLLNAYFTRMVDVVFRHDGTLDKFVGDALIVVFNDPFEQPDAERRAVACAAAMQAEIAAFNKEQAAAGKKTLGVGIGVHCGPVVAGNVGSEYRMDYTVMGDTVNFASRLQGKAPAGAVFVSEAVRAKTEGEYEYKGLGGMDFKGYAGPAQVFQLAGPRAAPVSG
ncbi:MAG: adenylate/guanylate cyclase domain-containing protein [Elusimicrobiales bacterium]|nr:adenylate/guanylate cyclase domain-containing protein [Elusimicrobiales bacterium]